MYMQAVAISHYGIIANMYQMGAYFSVFDPPKPTNRFVPGDVVLGGL